MRVRVRIDISRPLRRGVKIILNDALGGSWIPVQYERLPNFCFYCGIIGHLVKDCGKVLSIDRSICSSFNYGEWLRFDPKGVVMTGIPAGGVAVGLEILHIHPRNPSMAVSMVRFNGSAFGGVRIRSQLGIGRQQENQSATWYSLSGGAQFQDKGKGKQPEFTSVGHLRPKQWQASSSSSQIPSVGGVSPMNLVVPGGLGHPTVSTGELNEMERCNQIINDVFNDIMT